MKRLVLACIFSFASVLIFSGCDSSESTPAPIKEAAKDAGAVIDYGMGGTAVKAQKKIKQDLQKINQQHNKEMEKNLE